MAVHVLVVIVTYNSEEVVGGCLTSLADAWLDSTRCSIVVADNDSTDGTNDVVRSVAPTATLVSLDRNRGYAAGINAGIAAGLADDIDAVLVLNPDVRLDPGAGTALLEALGQSGTGIAVPRLRDVEGVLQPSLRREPTVLRELGAALLGGGRAGRIPMLGEVVSNPKRYARSGTADWATGAALMISRACLEAVGPWDESYFLYSEETDFCTRARDASFAVRYEPRAGAVHVGGESNTSPVLWSLLTRNRVRWYRRRHGAARSAVYFSAALLNEGLRALGGRTTNQAAFLTLVRRNQPDVPGLSMRGFVCFSAQDWWYFNRGHSDFQLMTRVAREHPVLLVNSVGMRMPTRTNTSTPLSRIWRKIRSATRGLRSPLPDVPNFHVFTPLFLPVYGAGLLARLNQRLVLAQVRRACRRVDMLDPAVVVTLPTAWPVARQLARSCTIVYRSDRYSALPEADETLVRALEVDLLAAADVALFASVALHDDEATLTRRPVLLSHGVDLDRFRPASDLTELASFGSIRRPRIGYVGMIDSYTVDLTLLERVADDHPEAQVVLAGPLDVPIDRLVARSNVHHLGVLPFTEVPSFLAGIDVALMPWQRNEWIKHCSPIKLKEYLAAGLPVVSTAFPEAQRFQDVIALARTDDEFSALVGEALRGNGRSTPTQRRAAVSLETWDAQAARLVMLASTPTGDREVAHSEDRLCAAS
ncbi:MAG TPA: glycosyltransferase [Ilumatobacter sp.]|nr:glycosyltransferase [Ilumatobacter sp.]